jgi:hypothetical protein
MTETCHVIGLLVHSTCLLEHKLYIYVPLALSLSEVITRILKTASGQGALFLPAKAEALYLNLFQLMTCQPLPRF